MGKILIVNTGPVGQERFSSYPVDDKEELDAPPLEWAQAALERLAGVPGQGYLYLSGTRGRRDGGDNSCTF